MREVFDRFGPIADLYYAMDKMTGKPRGFAFVTYENREAGEEAIKNLDGTEFNGRNLKVNEAQERAPRPSYGGGGGGGGGRGGHGGGRGGGRGRDDRRRSDKRW